MMLELVNKLGVKHYFKKDLQKYLPSGYVNKKYIDQFHAIPENIDSVSSDVPGNLFS